MTIEQPIEKRKQIKNLLKLKTNQKIKIREFARIWWFLTSCCPAVNHILNIYIDDLSINPIRFSKYDREIYSDASLSGWGVCCNSKRVNGYWKENEKYLSINHLELLVVFFGLKIFASE